MRQALLVASRFLLYIIYTHIPKGYFKAEVQYTIILTPIVFVQPLTNAAKKKYRYVFNFSIINGCKYFFNLAKLLQMKIAK